MGVLLLVIAWPVEEKNKSQSNQWDSKNAMIGLQSDGEESTGSKVGNKEADSSLASYAARTERSLEELLT